MGSPRFQLSEIVESWKGGRPSARSFALREAGIPVVMRIAPLFPRSPLPCESNLRDFGLMEAQNDLENHVAFARDVGVRHVVYSIAKIVQPRGRPLSPTMTAMREVYRALCAPGTTVWRDFSWRLPQHVAEQQIIRPFREICRRAGVADKFCMRDLVEIP